MAYLGAIAAHPAFLARFARDLVQPGLRIPLTADVALFYEAVDLGREVVWLHTFGERFSDPASGRSARPPRLPRENAPYVSANGAIPGAPEPLPDHIGYDASKRRLHIGKGYIDNVPSEVWSYEVGGKQVLRQWFSCRRRDRSRPILGDKRPPSPLDYVQPESWVAEYTTDLLDLLNVLGRLVALEPKQAGLLARVCHSPTLDVAELEKAGALALPEKGSSGPASASNRVQGSLLD
jgi:hypothetical protein